MLIRLHHGDVGSRRFIFGAAVADIVELVFANRFAEIAARADHVFVIFGNLERHALE